MIKAKKKNNKNKNKMMMMMMMTMLMVMKMMTMTMRPVEGREWVRDRELNFNENAPNGGLQQSSYHPLRHKRAIFYGMLCADISHKHAYVHNSCGKESHTVHNIKRSSSTRLFWYMGRVCLRRHTR